MSGTQLGTVVDYAEQHPREAYCQMGIDRQSVYDLVRATDRELGKGASDQFEWVERAQAPWAATRGREV